MKSVFASLILLLGIGIAWQSCTQGSGRSNEDNYTLVWSDEFGYTGYPDSSKWQYAIGDGCPELCGWGNEELQYYTRRSLKNARVAGGLLTIEVHPDSVINKRYSSAKLVTKDIQDWKYGRFEIRAKLPESNGIWSAIWMLPSDTIYGSWPKSGEIDIVENVGFDPDSVVASIHTASNNFGLGNHLSRKLAIEDNSTAFHIYTLDWQEDKLVFSVDDHEYFTYIKDQVNTAYWPFDQPMYLILNVAYGGNWGGQMGLEPEKLPQRLEIDYVRVYQRKNEHEGSRQNRLNYLNCCPGWITDGI